MAELEGEPIVEPRLKLQGTLGMFEIPNAKIKVRFFSTSASNRNKSSMEYEFLKELKPMRERTESDKIGDLEVLFQRDLNDSRIANSLVPYLLGKNSPVAFFPAILGVLIPKDFLASSNNNSYPHLESKDGSDNIITYGNFWEVEILKLQKKLTNFGVISINPSNTTILVLDGQHRANAFRYVTDTFLKDKDGVSKNDIYSTFYEKAIQPKGFVSDLPVTLIWFENSEKEVIEPNLISRKLFVDVNNTSRKVNKSRQILLDDFEIPSLLTRFFYSYIAEKNKFAESAFSLFYSGFDVDSDADRGKNNPFIITSPQKVREIFSWLFLGPRTFNGLNYYKIQRQSFHGFVGEYEAVFSTKVGESDSERKIIIRDYMQRGEFEDEFVNKIAHIFYYFFNEFKLYKMHFEAALLVKKYIVDEGDTTQEEVWEKVFKGGEGLYYTFQEERDNKPDLNDNPKLRKYIKAIDSIENKLREYKHGIYNSSLIDGSRIASVHSVVTSIAFQVGVFMGLDIFKEQFEDDSYEASYEEYFQYLNEVELDEWATILVDLKTLVMSGSYADPKAWPTYQKIMLRIIQDKNSDYSWYDSTNFEYSPDGIVFMSYIKRKFDSWFESTDFDVHEDVELKKLKISSWVDESLANMQQLFKRCGLKMIQSVDYKSFATQYLSGYINQ